MFARAVHPGEILKEELAELGITPTEFSRQIGVPPNRVSQIISVFEEYEENPEKFIELKRQITTWYSEKFGLSAFKRYKELVDKVCG